VRRLTACAIAAAIAALGACGGGTEKPGAAKPEAAMSPVPAAAAAVQLDVSTPDRALKSYWALKDQVLRRSAEITNRVREERNRARDAMKPVVSDEVLGSYHYSPIELESFSRDILEVKVESESRAVVNAIIKNITPLPAGATPVGFMTKEREAGTKVRYVMDRTVDGWRVAEVWTFGVFKDEWEKVVPVKAEPSVPYLVFDAI